jgi:chromosome segregation ATPase
LHHEVSRNTAQVEKQYAEQLDALKSELEALSERTEHEAQRNVDALNEQIQSLTERAEQSQSRIDSAEKQHSDTARQYAEQLDALKAELEAVNTSSATQEQTEALNEHIAALKDTLVTLSETVEQKAEYDAITTLEKRLDTLAQGIADDPSAERLDTVERGLAVLSEHLQEGPSHEHLSALEQRFSAQLVQLKDTLDAQYARKVDTEAQQRDATQALESAFATLSERIEAAEGAHGALTAEIDQRADNTERDIGALREQFTGFVSEQSSAVEQLTTQQREQAAHTEALVESLDTALKEHAESTTERIATLRTEARQHVEDSAEETLESAKQYTDEHATALSTGLTELNKAYNETRALQDEQSTRIDALRDETKAEIEAHAGQTAKRFDEVLDEAVQSASAHIAVLRTETRQNADGMREEIKRIGENTDERIDALSTAIGAENAERKAETSHLRACIGDWETNVEDAISAVRRDAAKNTEEARIEAKQFAADSAFSACDEAKAYTDEQVAQHGETQRELIEKRLSELRTALTEAHRERTEAIQQKSLDAQEYSEARIKSAWQHATTEIERVDIEHTRAFDAVSQHITEHDTRLRNIDERSAMNAGELVHLRHAMAQGDEALEARITAVREDISRDLALLESLDTAQREEIEVLRESIEGLDARGLEGDGRVTALRKEADELRLLVELQRDELNTLVDTRIDETHEALRDEVEQHITARHGEYTKAQEREMRHLVSEAIDEIRTRAKGDRGPEGYLRTARTYVKGDQYSERELVRHRKGLWQARSATRDEPSAESDDWMLLSDGIADLKTHTGDELTHEIRLELSSGEVHTLAFDTPRLRDCGTWKRDESYGVADSVMWKQVRWVAKRKTQSEPGQSDDWYVEAMAGPKGRKGDPGERGERGLRGERGEKGEPGVAPSAEAIARAFEAQLIEQDGYAVTRFRGQWQFDTAYRVGDLIGYAKGLYLCNTAHRAEMPPISMAVVSPQAAYWTTVMPASGGGALHQHFTSVPSREIVMAESILSSEVIALDAEGKGIRADRRNTSAVSVVGIASNDAGPGESIALLTAPFNYPGTIVGGQSIFLGDNGGLTTSAPSSGWLRQVAVAIDASTIVVDIGTAYYLGP